MAETFPRDQSGLTLPVWVAAAARAAVQILRGEPFQARQTLQVPDRSDPVVVAVQSGAPLRPGRDALAISRCDPGPGLDLTRDLEIWVRASWRGQSQGADWLELIPGEGVGRLEGDQQLCISDFARRLLELNLRPLLPEGHGLRLDLILPVGRSLAERTSNAAFGVVDGLALIGTQAEVQASASPEQLAHTLDQLRALTQSAGFKGDLVLVIGENGRDLARRSGLADQAPVLKAGNWIGPLLVAAAEVGVQNLLLLGYHGKLIKLAGGIFHTHHHLADGRLEVLMALAIEQGWPAEQVRPLLELASVEAALQELDAWNRDRTRALWQAIAGAVEARSQSYLARYGSWPLEIGAVLFDRSRRLRWAGPRGLALLECWGVELEDPH
jgi:cobalt-precorrin-5B (C1)-methyltransferase